MATKALVHDLLAALPTKRQANQFLKRKHRTLILLDSALDVQHQISDLVKLNLDPIVLFQSRLRHRSLAQEMEAAFRFMETIPDSLLLNDLADNQLLENIDGLTSLGLA
jgi:hypothetical protein